MTPIFCSRCGEFTIAYTTVNGTIYCRECFEELEFSHNLEYLKKQKGNKK
jgi:formylmethanofuran dehydrogenase subunit E